MTGRRAAGRSTGYADWGANVRVVTFEVENYRSVGARVALTDLGALVVLHGENDTGKSNLLAALKAAFGLLGDGRIHARALVGDPQEFPPIPGFVPHRARRGHPTRLRVVVMDPAFDVELVVDTKADRHVIWFEHLRADGVDVTFPLAEPVSAQLRRIAEACRFVDEQRFHQRGWDRALLDARDADAVGDGGRGAWRRVEHALGAFPGMAGGRLDRVLQGNGHELAWEQPDGTVVPFSSRGSGLRAARDVLIAAHLEQASVVAIEEPELHLSEESQKRLREALHKAAAASGQQLFLTSHTWAFDGAGPTWTLRLDAGETRVSRTLDQPVRDDALPGAGWVAASGMLQLPASVRQALGGVPQHVHFAPDQADPDLWLMLTDAAFRARQESPP